MNNIVQEYVLSPWNRAEDGTLVLSLPRGAKPLYVGMENNSLMLWVEKNTFMLEHELRRFVVYVSGQEFRHGKQQYIGTVQGVRGRFVLHVYEVLS
jgi:hypothetical protein